MGLVVDNFAGGGGASTGIEQALGRAVDIAINHDEQALRMHEANHPGTRHIRNNIWQVDPVEATGGQPVDLAWFSPDCKHFSKAKGGKPREKSIRDLAWVVVLWAQRVKPRCIFLENVEEFRTWGPLDQHGNVIKERAGETFDKWCKALRRQGYKLQFRELRACDYGAPTIRKRFFMIARRDGEAIVWPEPTHGKPDSPEVMSGKRLPWRTAAEIIDWSVPCPSIFERKKPLADKTLRRIAHGIMKFVVNNPTPFIVGTSFTNTRASRVFDLDEPVRTQTAQPEYAVVEPKVAPFATYAQQGGANRSLEDPLHTICASKKDQNCVVAAHLIHRGNGERAGQAPRAMDVEQPLGTVVAGGTKHGVVAAVLERQFGKSTGADPADPLPTTTAGGGGKTAAVTAFMQKFAENGKGYSPDDPLHTVMAGAPRHAVIAAHVAQFSETREGRKLNPGHGADEPVSTIVQKGPLQAAVTSSLVRVSDTEETRDHRVEVGAFLVKYYGAANNGQELDVPLHTVTHQDRFGLVTVTIDGEEYVIVDIGMRMLTPRELFNAQGFPPEYIIDRDVEGGPITKTAQVAKCGNSVCPPIARALVAANFGEKLQAERKVA